MDDETDDTLKLVKMGADNNPSATSRLVSLQTRKQVIEEKITLKNKELRKLCIQEAELTGSLPAEIPLEPGETLPTFRRRVGTAFEYPENIINNKLSNEDSIPNLETQIQVQKKIVEAALQLANNATISKSIKRKNMHMYRQTKQQLEVLEDRLENLKTQGHSTLNSQNQQLKQKKKPRPPLEADTISTKSNSLSQNEDSHSAHSLQQIPRPESTHFGQDVEGERYMLPDSKYSVMYKTPNAYVMENETHNPNNQTYNIAEDGLVTTLNRLSVNSYTSAKDRRSSESSNSNSYTQSYTHSHSNPNIYQPQVMMPNSHTLPHMSHINSPPIAPPNQYQTPIAVSHPNLNFPGHPHTLHHPNSRVRYYADEPLRKYATENYRNGYNNQEHNNYTYYPTITPQHAYTMHPNMSSQSYKQQQYCYNTMDANSGYASGNLMNTSPHHSHAHQQQQPPPQQQQQQQQQQQHQYESDGLGGHWMKTETGEMIWCPTMQHDDAASTNWQADKRFGSLDRRKGKHVHPKRASPSLDTMGKQATLRAVANSQQELTRQQMHIQSVPAIVRSSRHDNRQLVRTQSLGSVGAQTVDSVWPSDDNSSYDSDGLSVNELNAASRKLKQKGWCETSLDGPPPAQVQNTPQNTPVPMHEPRSPAQLPISPHPSVSSMSPRTPKPALEIPAESNPSPMHPDTNIELYNNNVMTELPKNCTVVQAGQCKPYREVTKPFEMADFYKYSTKFRERNQSEKKDINICEQQQQQQQQLSRSQDNRFSTSMSGVSYQRSGQDQCDGHDEVDDVFQKSVYLPLAPMKCQPLSPTSNYNRSFTSIGSPNSENANNISLNASLGLNTSNVAEHFSAEMNAWYQSHGQPVLENNNPNTSPVSIGRSTATLV